MSGNRGRYTAGVPSKPYTPSCDQKGADGRNTCLDWISSVSFQCVARQRKGVEGGCAAEKEGKEHAARVRARHWSMRSEDPSALLPACSSQPPSPFLHCLCAPHKACRAWVHLVYIVWDGSLYTINSAALRAVRLADAVMPVVSRSRRVRKGRLQELERDHVSAIRLRSQCLKM